MKIQTELSRLIIPNDVSYLGVASNYVGEISAKCGFCPQDRTSLEEGMREVLGRIIHYSFEPLERAEIEISCERTVEGLKVVVTDQGLPLDPHRPPVEKVRTDTGGTEEVSWAELFSHYMDEVYFKSLGPSGKQTVLVKYCPDPIEGYFKPCPLGPYAPIASAKSVEGTRFTIREMQPPEAVEVAKLIYEAYGYSYGVEQFYYPERIEEYNLEGYLLSHVAVSAKNEIAAHGALARREHWPRIVEMGQGVVKPEFRGHGCFNLLTEHMVKKAKSLGYMGIFARGVTVHPYSQQTLHRFGFQDCAITLGYGPKSTSYKGLRETLAQRISLTTAFLYFGDPPKPAIYAPPHHREIILKLYRQMGVEPEFRDPVRHDLYNATGSVRHGTHDRTAFGEIEVERFGRDTVPEVRRRLRQMCCAKAELIGLWLDMSDPAVFYLTEEFEAMGFFFAGILPGAGVGDALMLQYLNNMPLDYGEIQLESEMAKELLTYIREHDPNVID
ncbi:MAG: GNAT family N-acetyltransferase [Pseudomonadota bacterium]